MGSSEDGKTGSLVAATRLDTNETVLDNVDTTNTVAASNLVSSKEQLHGVSDSLVTLVGDLSRNTLVEVNDEVLRGIGGISGINSELPHVLGGSGVGILKNTGLEGNVSKVLVGRPGLSLGLSNRDTLGSSVFKKILAANKSLDEFRITPRSNDLDIGLQGVESKLESDLIVTLTGATVGDSEAALLAGNIDLSASNNGTSEGST